MIPYRIGTLFSGSTGNCTYIETPRARILIDAGKCTKTLLSSLSEIGVSPDSIDAIFITHEHNDHISALPVLSKKCRIPVYMVYESARRYEKNPPRELCECLCLQRDKTFSVQVGDMTVTAFPTPHDSRASVGYRITVSEAGGSGESVALGVATDIGYVTDDIRDGLRGCRSVVIESNHDIDMLREGPYPYDLKQRILSRHGHLSNTDCADFCAWLALHGTVDFLLAHLSEQNNIPDIAYDETFAALSGDIFNLRVAAPDSVTLLCENGGNVIPKAQNSLVTKG
ncbi:MAG: MBL fold metallo-hydrolase [Clostridia bacterium]|nr:MBL fold metallo-hydrolase [Clostridia bacterium]